MRWPGAVCCGSAIQTQCTVGWCATERKGLQDWGYVVAGDAGPLFPPQCQNADEAQTSVLSVLRRPPEQFGFARSRWRLSDLLTEWGSRLTLHTEGGLSQYLKRLGIHYTRGRDYVHSPDPNYTAKLSLIELCRLRCVYAADRYVFLYQDEVTYYRQPSLSYAYEHSGRQGQQPLAQRSLRSNSKFRIAATLDALTGRVVAQQSSVLDRPQFVHFLADVCSTYPEMETIYMVVDNWPLHFHPDVLACLEPQRYLLWPSSLPAHWPTEPTVTPRYTNLPIQLLSLPTYASWLNPIEKLWRWLKQDILHLHRHSDDWQQLRQRIDAWLLNFCSGSPELLRYVGLLPN